MFEDGLPLGSSDDHHAERVPHYGGDDFTVQFTAITLLTKTCWFQFGVYGTAFFGSLHL